MKLVSKRENGSVSVKTVFAEGEGRTQQHFEEQANINSVIAKHKRAGINPHNAGAFDNPANFGDFTKCVNLHDAMLQVEQANQAFMALPSSIRNRFKNDPQELLDFVQDENNRQEAIELGLVSKPPEEPVVKVGDNPPEPAPEVPAE